MIAGDVQTVSSETNQYPMLYAAKTSFARVADAPSFAEKSFADYHMYTLSAPVTLN